MGVIGCGLCGLYFVEIADFENHHPTCKRTNAVAPAPPNSVPPSNVNPSPAGFGAWPTHTSIPVTNTFQATVPLPSQIVRSRVAPTLGEPTSVTRKWSYVMQKQFGFVLGSPWSYGDLATLDERVLYVRLCHVPRVLFVSNEHKRKSNDQLGEDVSFMASHSKRLLDDYSVLPPDLKNQPSTIVSLSHTLLKLKQDVYDDYMNYADRMMEFRLQSGFLLDPRYQADVPFKDAKAVLAYIGRAGSIPRDFRNRLSNLLSHDIIVKEKRERELLAQQMMNRYGFCLSSIEDYHHSRSPISFRTVINDVMSSFRSAYKKALDRHPTTPLYDGLGEDTTHVTGTASAMLNVPVFYNDQRTLPFEAKAAGAPGSSLPHPLPPGQRLQTEVSNFQPLHGQRPWNRNFTPGGLHNASLDAFDDHSLLETPTAAATAAALGTKKPADPLPDYDLFNDGDFSSMFDANEADGIGMATESLRTDKEAAASSLRTDQGERTNDETQMNRQAIQMFTNGSSREEVLAFMRRAQRRKRYALPDDDDDDDSLPSNPAPPRKTFGQNHNKVRAALKNVEVPAENIPQTNPPIAPGNASIKEPIPGSVSTVAEH